MSQARTTQILEKMTAIDGGVYIADTDEHTPSTGVFTQIYTLEATTLTLVGNVTGLTSVALPAGTPVLGAFTSLTLASGRVIAYEGVR